MSDLPPLEEPQAYVVVGPDDQRGPYTMELLIGEVLAGRLSDATPVWWPGLADWTTMGGHPALAAEIQRRRGATSAPGWAAGPGEGGGAPQPSYEPQGYAQPQSYEQPQGYDQGYGQPEQQSYEQPYAQPETQGYAQPQSFEQPQSYEQPQGYDQGYGQPEQQAYDQPQGYEPTAFGSTSYQESDAAAPPVEPGGYIDVESSPGAAAPAAVEVPEAVRQEFEGLVARSGARAATSDRIASAEEDLVQAATEGATSQGWSPAGRDVVDGFTELRFDRDDDTHLVVAVGRLEATSLSELQRATVPLQVSVRSGSQGGAVHSATGSHGEVIVVADEWSGQTTSSVSLVLGMEDYLTADGTVDRAPASRDVAAAVAVVHSRLGGGPGAV